MSLSVSRCVALAGLILANLALDVGLMWLIQKYPTGWNWVDQIYIGFLIGQLMLVGLWFGLGDGRWYLRLVVAVALTLGLVRTIGIAEQMTTRVPDGSFPATLVFILLPMMLAAGWLGFVLRRMWGWQLSWQPATGVVATRQFQIGDVMLWTVMVAGALASFRFIVTLDKDFPAQFLEIGMYTAKTMAAVLATLVAAFVIERRGRALALLLFVVIAIGAVFALPDAYANARSIRGMFRMPTPAIDYAIAAAKEVMKHEVYIVSAALAALANCIVLRALGCKLARPQASAAS